MLRIASNSNGNSKKKYENNGILKSYVRKPEKQRLSDKSGIGHHQEHLGLMRSFVDRFYSQRHF